MELHLVGAIDVGRRGLLRRVVHSSPGRDATSLRRATWTAFGRELSSADTAAAPAVRRAREEVRTELTGRGLRCGRARLAVACLLAMAAGGTAVAIAAQEGLWTGLPLAVLSLTLLCAPARTLAGHRLLREMRRLHPLPGATPAEPGEIGLLVALHGRRALRLLVPEFAARAALLGGRAARETVARSEGDSFGHSALSGTGEGT
ncbi:hypothetical protein ACFY2K_16645 [Kitasatospora sp. NPDC001309]|uniref:hypothetical protein n=1 Tax=Kitasatospora sp. NPDC001309 TaxID=3364013 RepID=UPI0036BAE50A